MSCARRYTCARGVSHESKTASTARGQLVAGVLRERMAEVVLVDRLEALDQPGEVVCREVDVVRDAAIGLQLLQLGLEAVRVDPVDDLPVHLDQPAVRVVREARVARSTRRGPGPPRRSGPGSGSCPSSRASRRPRPTGPRRAAGPAGRRTASRPCAPSRARARRSRSSSPSGSSLPCSMYARHASVVIVNPAGTGRPSWSSPRARCPCRRGARARPRGLVEVVDVAVCSWSGIFPGWLPSIDSAALAARSELGHPGERTQPEPERREQPIEENERGAERRVPDGPAPQRDGRLGLHPMGLPASSRRRSTRRMMRWEISSIEAQATSSTGQPSRRCTCPA